MPNESQNIDLASLPLNRDIEQFLMTSEFLEINYEFGWQQMNAYTQDLMFLQAGGKFKDLGISERRKSALPSLIVPQSAESFTLVDNWDMMMGDTPPGSIALLKLSGVMRTQSAISSPGIDRLSNDMRSAYNNSNIKGIIVDTYSGGGESSAGSVLKSVYSERNKPVVVFGHLVASAAFRASSGADEIVMSSMNAEVGSLGTMIPIDLKILNRIRETTTTFYGADAPNKNIEERAAIAGDFSVLQKRVDELTRQFHDEIKRDRNLQGDAATIKETLSGKMFTAADGKRRGLVDAIGNLNFAIRRVNALQSKYKTS